METTKLSENFSCIEMKRQIQAEIHTETKGMTTEERVAYYNLVRDKKSTPQPRTSVRRVVPRKRKELA